MSGECGIERWPQLTGNSVQCSYGRFRLGLRRDLGLIGIEIFLLLDRAASAASVGVHGGYG